MDVEYQSDAGSTKNTIYLAGKVWGIFCEYLWESWLHQAITWTNAD